MAVINLNADVGESYGRFRVGNDEAMMKVIKSASIACGFHGGDPLVMANAVRLAHENGVSIGAHPSFHDIQGFGRRQIRMSAKELEYMVAYQIGALNGIAAGVGTKVTHVKPHGALNNMAHDDPVYALAIARAIRSIDREIIYVATAYSEMVRAGRNEGLRVAEEAYADRTYEDDGSLSSREHADALITEPGRAVKQVMTFMEQGAIVSRSGKKLAARIHTLCVHGDEPSGVAVVTAVREALEKNGVRVVPLPELSF
jgi:UPF0271 protein